MIDFDDLTEAELAMRDILSHPGKLARFAQQARERWARTPEGKLAIRECENRRGKVRRRVQAERAPDEPHAAPPSE